MEWQVIRQAHVELSLQAGFNQDRLGQHDLHRKEDTAPSPASQPLLSIYSLYNQSKYSGNHNAAFQIPRICHFWWRWNVWQNSVTVKYCSATEMTWPANLVLLKQENMFATHFKSSWNAEAYCNSVICQNNHWNSIIQIYETRKKEHQKSFLPAIKLPTQWSMVNFSVLT